MTNQQHPITPPPAELVHQWHKEACKDPYNGGTFFESKPLKHIATQAARWGADQELEACEKFILSTIPAGAGSRAIAEALRAARRPKPLSQADAALKALDEMDKPLGEVTGSRCATIRTALKRLKELEALPNDN